MKFTKEDYKELIAEQELDMDLTEDMKLTLAEQQAIIYEDYETVERINNKRLQLQEQALMEAVKVYNTPANYNKMVPSKGRKGGSAKAKLAMAGAQAGAGALQANKIKNALKPEPTMAQKVVNAVKDHPGLAAAGGATAAILATIAALRKRKKKLASEGKDTSEVDKKIKQAQEKQRKIKK